jgi:glucose/arabinose dehydrogenase
MGDRDERGRAAQVERRLVEGDEETEPERHRRRAEREHQQGVERPRRAGAAAGDGGRGQSANAEDTRSLLGKILRLDVDRASGGRAYAIPADNPFADGAGGAPEVWAYGLRHPFRFSFDRKTGGLYVGDVGQDEWEEIDYGAPGRGGLNFGWDTTEGRRCYDPPTGCDRTGIAFPIHAYSHEAGNAVTGGYVYRGRAVPGLVGTYVFADFGSRELWGLKRDRDGAWRRSVLLRRDEELWIASFGESDAGELLAVDLVAGVLYRVAKA